MTIPVDVSTWPGILPAAQDQVSQFATEAHNVLNDGGVLRPMPCPTVVCEYEGVETIRTILEVDDCDCPVVWDKCVDVATWDCTEGESVHFLATGDAPPGMASSDQLCSGETCPVGPSCPSEAPTVTTGLVCEGPECGSDPVSYVYTFRNQYGHEGPPSPASLPVYGNITGPVALSGIEVPDDDCVAEVCVYRLITGYKTGDAREQTTNRSAFFLVGCVPVGSQTFIDPGTAPKPKRLNTQGAATWPDATRAFVQTQFGTMLGAVGSQVHVSLARRPHLFAAQRGAKTLDVKDKVRCLIECDRAVFVLTDGQPGMITTDTVDQGHRYSYRRFKGKFPLCSKKGAVVFGDAGVYFASTHGIVFMDAQGPRYISNSIWTREQWAYECCEQMVLGMFHGDLIVRGRDKTYLISVNDGTYNQPEQMGVRTTDMRPDAFFETKDGRILYSEGNIVYEMGALGDACECCPMKYTLPLLDFRELGNYEAAQLNLLPQYGELKMTLWSIDCGMKTKVDEITVADCHPFVLAGCYLTDQYQITIEGCGRLRSLRFAPSMDQLSRAA